MKASRNGGAEQGQWGGQGASVTGRWVTLVSKESLKWKRTLRPFSPDSPARQWDLRGAMTKVQLPGCHLRTSKSILRGDSLITLTFHQWSGDCYAQVNRGISSLRGRHSTNGSLEPIGVRPQKGIASRSKTFSRLELWRTYIPGIRDGIWLIRQVCVSPGAKQLPRPIGFSVHEQRGVFLYLLPHPSSRSPPHHMAVMAVPASRDCPCGSTLLPPWPY